MVGAKNQNPVDFVSHPTFSTKRLRNVLGSFLIQLFFKKAGGDARGRAPAFLFFAFHVRPEWWVDRKYNLTAVPIFAIIKLRRKPTPGKPGGKRMESNGSGWLPSFVSIHAAF